MIKINADRKAIENLPPHIFSNLGLNQIAYIKPLNDHGDMYFAVHAADGKEISYFSDKSEAEDFIKLQNLMAITVH